MVIAHDVTIRVVDNPAVEFDETVCESCLDSGALSEKEYEVVSINDTFENEDRICYSCGKPTDDLPIDMGYETNEENEDAMMRHIEKIRERSDC